MSGDQPAGYHSIEWNGLGNSGQQLASGVYFLQMSAKGVNGATFTELRKMMLMK
jgi:flagellar hook assembly protein FlgD